jgi:hypothetical protein
VSTLASLLTIAGVLGAVVAASLLADGMGRRVGEP